MSTPSPTAMDRWALAVSSLCEAACDVHLEAGHRGLFSACDRWPCVDARDIALAEGMSGEKPGERELTLAERSTWGTCAFCGAAHGEPCTPVTHFGRLARAPRSVPA